jgi:hypothetical protein
MGMLGLQYCQYFQTQHRRLHFVSSHIPFFAIAFAAVWQLSVLHHDCRFSGELGCNVSLY